MPVQTTKVNGIKGSIRPLKAWWDSPGPRSCYPVTGHNEWGVVYVVKCCISEPFEDTSGAELGDN